MRKRGVLILWPVYFDSRISRNSGRRIPLKNAIEAPKLDELVKVARALKLEYEVESEASHPRFWWRKEGRITIKGSTEKSSILKQFSTRLRKLRAK
ncbi:MAG: signal recognition particle subunit SRP19/SEC65 family protein [Candidatus Hodarchaeota archaeon]